MKQKPQRKTFIIILLHNKKSFYEIHFKKKIRNVAEEVLKYCLMIIIW